MQQMTERLHKDNAHLVQRRDFQVSSGGATQGAPLNNGYLIPSQYNKKIKQRIVEQLEYMNEEELENLKQTLGVSAEDYDEGAANKYEEEDDLVYTDTVGYYGGGDLKQQNTAAASGQFENDDLVSQWSRYTKSSILSRGRSSAASSSKTYVSKLEKKLNTEKHAREKLQREVDELRKMSTMINS